MFPIAAATGTHTQEEQSLCVLGGLLFSTSVPSGSPACWMELYAFRLFLLSCHPTCQSSLKMPPETHLEVYTYFTHVGPLCCLRRIPEPSSVFLHSHLADHSHPAGSFILQSFRLPMSSPAPSGPAPSMQWVPCEPAHQSHHDSPTTNEVQCESRV